MQKIIFASPGTLNAKPGSDCRIQLSGNLGKAPDIRKEDCHIGLHLAVGNQVQSSKLAADFLRQPQLEGQVLFVKKVTVGFVDQLDAAEGKAVGLQRYRDKLQTRIQALTVEMRLRRSLTVQR